VDNRVILSRKGHGSWVNRPTSTIFLFKEMLMEWTVGRAPSSPPYAKPAADICRAFFTAKSAPILVASITDPHSAVNKVSALLLCKTPPIAHLENSRPTITSPVGLHSLRP
jgi:hypothetical protein